MCLICQTWYGLKWTPHQNNVSKTFACKSEFSKLHEFHHCGFTLNCPEGTLYLYTEMSAVLLGKWMMASLHKCQDDYYKSIMTRHGSAFACVSCRARMLGFHFLYSINTNYRESHTFSDENLAILLSSVWAHTFLFFLRFLPSIFLSLAQLW